MVPLLGMAGNIRADEPTITLSLNPLNGYEPLSTHVTLRIEPNYLNWQACVEWEGIPQKGYGCWSLDGQYERRTQDYDIKHLPACEYQVIARLYRVRSTHSTLAQTIRSLETPFH